MDFLDLSRTRYSVRKYAATPVEREKLDAVLEAGRLAPTATNAQPVHVIVVASDEARARLAEATPMAYDAPVSLLVCYDESEAWHNGREEGYHSGEMDASIVADEMMLMATELGLGTLWARGYKTADLERAMGVPENLTLACILDLGYPAEDSEPTANHATRKPMGEFVACEL